MVNRPSEPEIITVNSEALETTIRDLLPSQAGFGSELQASNVITPIIDLTATAEGSGLPQDFARALAFGSQTAFSVTNTTSTLASSPGFYRLIGTATSNNKSTAKNCAIQLTDGATTKDVWSFSVVAGTATDHLGPLSESFDVIVWLTAGDSVIVSSDATAARIAGSIRQVGNSEGSVQNPSGYPL